MTLVEFLRARLDEREQWALACSRPYEYADDGSKAPATGVHWQWVAGEDWDPVKPDPVTMDFVQGPDGSWSANLATVEKWRSSSRFSGEVIRTTMMPRVYANSIEEMDPAAAGHIALNDPAYVLADVGAKRAIVDLHREANYDVQGERTCVRCVSPDEWTVTPLSPEERWPCLTLRLLALPYADHPDYDPAWQAEVTT
jgi:hypothetical protein